MQTFQSVLDFTVSTPAILTALCAHLPANGSEVMLFDVNRIVKFGPLLRPAADSAIQRLTPAEAVAFDFTVIANAAQDTTATVERRTAAGTRGERVRTLDPEYPPQIFSLSHVAVPFPLDDPLYGFKPDPATASQYRVSLGAMSVRGERNALIVDQDFLTRIASNPFYPYMLARIEEGIAAPRPASAAKPAAPRPAAAARLPAAPPEEPVHQPAVDP